MLGRKREPRPGMQASPVKSHTKCLRNGGSGISEKNRTFFSAGASSWVPFASSSTLRFFPRGPLEFPSLSVGTLFVFLALGFVFWVVLGRPISLSLIREERRGSGGSPDSVEVAALRGIVEGGRRFKVKGRKWGSKEETRFGHPNRFNISLLIPPKQVLITCNVLGHAFVLIASEFFLSFSHEGWVDDFPQGFYSKVDYYFDMSEIEPEFNLLLD